jgi:hypothetical protein
MSIYTGSVADPDRFGPDPDPTSENRPDPDSGPDPVKTDRIQIRNTEQVSGNGQFSLLKDSLAG